VFLFPPRLPSSPQRCQGNVTWRISGQSLTSTTSPAIKLISIFQLNHLQLLLVHSLLPLQSKLDKDDDVAVAEDETLNSKVREAQKLGTDVMSLCVCYYCQQSERSKITQPSDIYLDGPNLLRLHFVAICFSSSFHLSTSPSTKYARKQACSNHKDGYLFP
jgi:hypothetical protein